MDPDRGLVPPGVVDHLADEGGHPVDGQAGAVFLFAVLLDALRPLLPQAGELEVVEGLLAVFRLGILAELERLAGFLDDVAVFSHSSHP